MSYSYDVDFFFILSYRCENVKKIYSSNRFRYNDMIEIAILYCSEYGREKKNLSTFVKLNSCADYHSFIVFYYAKKKNILANTR